MRLYGRVFPPDIAMLPPFDEIRSNFALLDEGNDQFEYLMELGRMLPPFPSDKHTDDRLVPGCQSRVWLDMTREGSGPGTVIRMEADSDALITKGLVAFLVALHSGERADVIVKTDAIALFRDLGLGQHVTSKRANGLRSMADRIRQEAERAAATA